MPGFTYEVQDYYLEDVLQLLGMTNGASINGNGRRRGPQPPPNVCCASAIEASLPPLLLCFALNFATLSCSVLWDDIQERAPFCGRAPHQTLCCVMTVSPACCFCRERDLRCDCWSTAASDYCMEYILPPGHRSGVPAGSVLAKVYTTQLPPNSAHSMGSNCVRHGLQGGSHCAPAAL